MYGQYVLRNWESAQIYPILDKAQSSLKDEIKGTLQILKSAKDSHKGQVSHFPETKDGEFVSVSHLLAPRVHFASTE